MFTYDVLAIIHHQTAVFFNTVQPAIGESSLQLSSYVWHYGDTVTWSAQGLTPNGIVTVQIQGAWGTLVLWDITANSDGSAGYSFNVGTNIQGGGQLTVTDQATGVVLQATFSLGIQQSVPSSLQLSSYNWHYGDTVSWSSHGLTPGAVIRVEVKDSGGTVIFWDATTDSSGKAGFSFTVGTNIQSSGQFVIVDTASGNTLSADYTLS